MAWRDITKNHYHGFSLIELLVVVAIIGIVSAIAVPAYSAHQVRSRISAAVTVLDSLAQQAIITYQRTGSFPN